MKSDMFFKENQIALRLYMGKHFGLPSKCNNQTIGGNSRHFHEFQEY